MAGLIPELNFTQQSLDIKTIDLASIPQTDNRMLSNNLNPYAGLNVAKLDGQNGYQQSPEFINTVDLKPISGYNEFKDREVVAYNPDIAPIQNQRPYAARQSNWEFTGNMLYKFGASAYNAFVNDFQQHSRNAKALFNWDANQLASSESDHAQDEIERLHPTMGSGQHADSALRFIPFIDGGGDFYGSMIPSLGFTAGTIGSTLLQNAALELGTAGLGSAVVAARTAFGIGRAIEKLYDGFVGAKALERGLKILNNITKEGEIASSLGGYAIKGMKGLANAYQMYNTAASEASFEGNMNYNETLADLKQNFIQKNGYNPFGADLKAIENLANKSKLDTFVGNLPILLASNITQFGNMLSPYKVGNDVFKNIVAKSAVEGAEATLKTFKPIMSFSNPTFQKIWNTGQKTFKASGAITRGAIPEGLEEISQSFLSKYNKAYYTALANGDDPKKLAMNAIGEYAFSKDFADDFVGGAFGGLVFQGGMHAINKLSGATKKEKEQELSIINQLNEVKTSDVLKEGVLRVQDQNMINLVKQDFNTKSLNESLKNGDILGYKDVQDNAFREFLYTGAQTGKLNIRKDQLSAYKLLEDDLFESTYGIPFSAENKEAVNDMIDAYLDRVDTFAEDFGVVSERYVNPYKVPSQKEIDEAAENPDLLSAVNESILKYNAFEAAKRDRMFVRDAVQRDKERQESIWNNIERATNSVVNRTMLKRTYDRDSLTKYKEETDRYIDMYSKAFSQDETQKEQIEGLQKKKVIIDELLKEFYTSTPNKYRDLSKYSDAVAEIAKIEGRANGKKDSELDDYDTDIVNKDLLHSLVLEVRNRKNIEDYNILNNRAGFDEYVAKHIESQKELVKAQKDKTETVHQAVANMTGDKSVTALPTNTATTTLNPTQRVPVKPAVIVPSVNDVNELTEEQLDKLNRDLSEAHDIGFKKDINVLYNSGTRKNYSLRKTEDHPEYLHREEELLHNMTNSKKGFSRDRKGSFVTMPVTQFNIAAVANKLGIAQSEIQHVLEQDKDHLFGTDNISGAVIMLYAHKGTDGSYTLIDKEGEFVTSDFKDKTVQSFLTDLTKVGDQALTKDSTPADIKKIAALLHLEDKKTRVTADLEQVEAAVQNNFNIRIAFLNNTKPQDFSFTISAGIPAIEKDSNGKKIKKALSIEDAGITNDLNKVRIIIQERADEKDSYSDKILIKGRFYLQQDVKQPNGDIVKRTTDLINSKLTDAQKDAVKKAIVDFVHTGNKEPLIYLNHVLQFENYLDGKSTIKNNKFFEKKLVLTATKEGKVRFMVLTDKGAIDQTVIDKDGNFSPNFNAWLSERYHNVRKPSAGKFYDYATGNTYASYTHYLLNRENPILTTSIKDITADSAEQEIPFVQKYPIIDFSKGGVKTVPIPAKKVAAQPKAATTKTVAKKEESAVGTAPVATQKKAPVPAPSNKQLNPKQPVKKVDNTGGVRILSYDANYVNSQGVPALKIFYSDGKYSVSTRDFIAGKNEDEVREYLDDMIKYPNEQLAKDFMSSNGIAIKRKEQVAAAPVQETQAPAPVTEVVEAPIVQAPANETETPSVDASKAANDMFGEFDNDAPFQVAYDSDFAPVTEEDIAWFKSVLPQIGLEYNPDLQRMSGMYQVWGAYKNANVTLYKGAVRNTPYHEAFEVVVNSIMSNKNQKKMYDDFRNRPGNFDTYLGRNIPYSAATNKEAKEELANEFFNYKKTRDAKADTKNFFQKLLSFIAAFIKRFTQTLNITQPSVEDVYDNILDGYYSKRKINSSSDEYFQIADLTEYDRNDFLKSITGQMTQFIVTQNASLLRKLDEGDTSVGELFDTLKQYLDVYYTEKEQSNAQRTFVSNTGYQYTVPSIKQAFANRRNELLREGLNAEDATKQAKTEYSLALDKWNSIKGDWNNYIDAHLNFISSFGISVDRDSSFRDDQTKIENGEEQNSIDYSKDYLKYDDFRQVSASIKLILGTMVDGVVNPVNNNKTRDIVSERSFLPMVISDPKPFFNRLINTLGGLNNPIQVKAKLQDIMTPRTGDSALMLNLRGQFSNTLDLFLNKDVNQLSHDEMNLRMKFIGAVSSQKPIYYRQRIDGNSVYMVDELYDNQVKRYVDKALSKAVFAMFAAKKNKTPHWLAIARKEIYIDKKVLETSILEKAGDLTNNRQEFIDYINKSLQNIYFDFDASGLRNNDLEIMSDSLQSIKSYLTQNNFTTASTNLDNAKKAIKAVVGSQFNNIAEIMARNTFDDTTPQHINVVGEMQSNVIQNNFPSIVLADINASRTKDDLLAIHPYYNDVFVKNSLLLNKILFDENGDRTDNTADIAIIGGTEVVNNEFATKETRKLTEENLYLSRFNGMLDNRKAGTTVGRKSMFPILENADGGIDWSLQTGNYIQSIDNREIGQISNNYLIDEIAHALEFKYGQTLKNENEELNKIVDERRIGESLQFYGKLLPQDIVDRIHYRIDDIQADPDEDYSALAEGIVAEEGIDTAEHYIRFAKQEAIKEIKYLMDKKIILKVGDDQYKFLLIDSDYSKEGLFSGQEIRDLMVLMQLNYQTHNIEMFKMFFGNPTYYADLMKRSKSFLSPALSTLHDTTGQYNDWFNQNLNTTNEGDITFHNFSNDLNFISIDDIITANDSLAKTVDEKYGFNNAVDAQSLMTMGKIRELFWKTGGVWTSAMEEQYQLDNAYTRISLAGRDDQYKYAYKSQALKAADKELISKYINANGIYEPPTLGYLAIIKPIQRGFKTGNVQIPSLVKTSSAPLTFSMVQGTKLEPIYLEMLKNGVDMLTYKSAHKVGQSVKDGSVQNIIGDDGNVRNLMDTGIVETVPMWTFQIQVETQGEKDSSTVGSQALKLATVDLYDNGVPKDYLPKEKDVFKRFEKWSKLSDTDKLIASEVYNLEKEHYNAINNLMEVNYNYMLTKLGATEEGNTFNIGDRQKFFDNIERQLTKHNIPLNILDQINFIREDRKLPIESIAEYQTIKHMIYSIANKEIVHYKLNGGQKIQLSSALLDRLDKTYDIKQVKGKGGKTSNILTNSELKFYEKGNQRGMEVMLSFRLFTQVNDQRTKMGLPRMNQEQLLVHLNQNPKLLEGCGFRVPSQALSSLDAFTIKGFLPEYLGDAIAVPAEITTKAGSDFDVDKLTTYLNNWTLNSKGLPEYVRPFQSVDEAKEYFRAQYVDRIQSKLDRLFTTDEYRDQVLAIFKGIESMYDENSPHFGTSLRDVIGDDLSDVYEITFPVIEQIMNDAAEEGLNPSEYIGRQIEAISNKKIKLSDILNNEAKISKYVDRFLKKSIQNDYFRTFRQLVLHPDNHNKLLTPNATDEFTEGKDGYKNRLDNMMSRTAAEKSITDFLSFGGMTRQRNLFIKSKGEVGIAVVGTTSHAMSQKVLGVITPVINEMSMLFDEENPIKFKHNTVSVRGNVYPTFSSVAKSDGMSITEFLGKYVSGAVDAVKSTWLAEMGAYKIGLPVAIIGERIGMDTNDIVLLLNHPLVKEYLKIKELATSQIVRADSGLSSVYGNLRSDEDIYNYLVGEVLETFPEFTKNAKKLAVNHIEAAGPDTDFFEKFTLSIEDKDEDKAVAASILKQFLNLKKYGSDMLVNNQASNHETMNFNSNSVLELKNANEKIAKLLSIKAISFDEDSNPVLIPYATAIKQNSFIGKVADKVQSFENGIYNDVLLPTTRLLIQKTIKKLSNDYQDSIFGDVDEIVSDYETILYSSQIQSADTPVGLRIMSPTMSTATGEIFSLAGIVFNKLDELRNRASEASTLSKIKEGLNIFDYVDLAPLGDTGYFYLKISNKPSSSDISGNNVLYDAMKNLKAKHPEEYNYLLAASILQSGIKYQKNNINSFALPSDYSLFTNDMANTSIGEDVFNMIRVIYAQNNSFKNGSGVLNLNNMMYGSKAFSNRLEENPKNIQIKNHTPNPEGFEIVIEDLAENVKISPTEWRKTGKYKKNYQSKFEYLSFTTGTGFTKKHYVLQDTGIRIVDKEDRQRTVKNGRNTVQMEPKKISYKVYRYIPTKGSIQHKEYKAVKTDKDYLSGFAGNNQLSGRESIVPVSSLEQTLSKKYGKDFDVSVQKQILSTDQDIMDTVEQQQAGKELYSPETLMKVGSINGIPIVSMEVKNNVGKRGAAQFVPQTAKTKKMIRVDFPEMRRKYMEKAWTVPYKLSDGSQATPISEDYFKSFNHFLTFVIIHEAYHDKYKKEKGESIGAYEDRISRAVMSRLTFYNVPKIAEAEFPNREIKISDKPCKK